MHYYQDQMIIFSEACINCQIYFYIIFVVYIDYFAAAEEKSTAKLSVLFQKFQAEERVL